MPAALRATLESVAYVRHCGESFSVGVLTPLRVGGAASVSTVEASCELEAPGDLCGVTLNLGKGGVRSAIRLKASSSASSSPCCKVSMQRIDWRGTHRRPSCQRQMRLELGGRCMGSRSTNLPVGSASGPSLLLSSRLTTHRSLANINSMPGEDEFRHNSVPSGLVESV